MGTTVEWSDDAELAQHLPNRALLMQLRDQAGRWAIFSTHRSRGAARQRIYSLRQSQTYRGIPVQWRTKKQIPGQANSPVHVLVKWDGPLEDA
jgi:hypothetical protein